MSCTFPDDGKYIWILKPCLSHGQVKSNKQNCILLGNKGEMWRERAALGKKRQRKISAIHGTGSPTFPVMVLRISLSILNTEAGHSASWVSDKKAAAVRLSVCAEGELLLGKGEWSLLASGPSNKAELERAWWQTSFRKERTRENEKKSQKKSKSNNSIIKKTKTLGEEWVKSHPGQVCQRRADI